jgi:hypothetical protein
LHNWTVSLPPASILNKIPNYKVKVNYSVVYFIRNAKGYVGLKADSECSLENSCIRFTHGFCKEEKN